MSHVGLSRAKHAIPIAKFVEETGTSIEPLLERVRLPPDCLTTPEMLVLTRCIREFREVAAQTLGRPNIVLEATRNLSLEQLGNFGDALAQTRCLYHSLSEFCALANTESSSVVLTLKPGKGCVYLAHRPLDKRRHHWNSELYMLKLMLWLVRLASPKWSPDHVDICFTSTSDRRAALQALRCEHASFGSKQTSIPIPKSMFALPLQLGLLPAGSITDSRERLLKTAPATTFTESLSQALRAYDLAPWTPIETVAEVAGVSKRTLQRRLGEDGMTYSTFAERKRFDHAIQWITKTDAPLDEIAARLGYTNHASFTRAFRRWAGVSPMTFRLQRQRND